MLAGIYVRIFMLFISFLWFYSFFSSCYAIVCDSEALIGFSVLFECLPDVKYIMFVKNKMLFFHQILSLLLLLFFLFSVFISICHLAQSIVFFISTPNHGKSYLLTLLNRAGLALKIKHSVWLEDINVSHVSVFVMTLDIISVKPHR